MKHKQTSPDYSNIDAEDKAIEKYRCGEFEKLFLFPIEFGGQDIPQNVVFVPVGFAKIKSNIEHNIIVPLVRDGMITKYVVTPVYQGRSFVPIAIDIDASEPGEFKTRINIWGEGLE